MTETIDVFTRQEHEKCTDVELRRIDARDPLFESWISAREEFVKAQGWGTGNDPDRYDQQSAKTLQLVNVTPQGIEAGLRLTPCDSIEATLSWSWLPPQLQEQARQSEFFQNEKTKVWDLTRLVASGASPDRKMTSIIELLGAGFEITERHDDSVPSRWVFATTPAFCRLFRQSGIEFTPIVQGKFSQGDKTDSVLCYADPSSRAEFLDESDTGHLTAVRDAVAKGRLAIRLMGEQS